MMTIAIISALVGIVLGTRFQLAVLALFVCLIAFAIVAAGLASGHDAWLMIKLGLLIVTTLQAGYLIGSYIRLMYRAAMPAMPTSAGPLRQSAE